MTFDPLKLVKSNVWLLKLSAPKTRFLPKLIFEGAALTGEHVVSNSVFFDVHAISTPTSTKLRLKGTAYHLRVDYVPYPKTSRDCLLVYRTIGMQAHGHLKAPTKWGNIVVAGPNKIKHYNWIHGSLSVKAPNKRQPSKNWIAACDRMTDRILELISFAEGRLIRWSVRSLYKRDNVVAHEFFGPQRTTEPHEPVFYFLNLQPVLDLAVSRYTQFVRRNLGFGVALEWFLQRPSYIEMSLLTSMTALEHLVSIFKHNYGGAKNIDKHVFKAAVAPSRKALKAITPASANEKEAIDLVLGKVMQSNDAPLLNNMIRMFKYYEAPTAGLDARLAIAIKARNNVVHRGLHSSKPHRKIYSHVEVLRELFTRTFLSVLNYTGQYRTWLDKSDEVAFPPGP